MVDRPRFTVLLPTHDRPEVLIYAIKSVLAQDFEDFELAVVGDGCGPETAALMKGITDPRVLWLDLPKAPGFGYANRNAALAQTSGDLVAFLGHDNLYLPDHLRRMDRHFHKDTRQFVYSRPLWIDDAGIVMPCFVNLHHPFASRRFMTDANILPASTVVYRRSAMDQVGNWPEDMEQTGDWDLWKRIFEGFLGSGFLHFDSEPTMLHFRANWRDPARWMPNSMSYLAALHRAGTFWPKGLDLGLDQNGDLPQAQVWALLHDNARDVTNRLRHGTRYLQDVLAHSATLDANFVR
ncbi:MAG: glycosyltransferase family A protein [Pseudomonadota bacterium]